MPTPTTPQTDPEIYRSLGRLEGTVNGIDEKVDFLLEGGEKRGSRIGILEQAKARSLGIVAGLSAAISLITTVAFLFLKALGA